MVVTVLAGELEVMLARSPAFDRYAVEVAVATVGLPGASKEALRSRNLLVSERDIEVMSNLIAGRIQIGV